MADTDDIVDAIGELKEAVEDVKKAVESKGMSAVTVVCFFVVIITLSWLGSAWNSKFRYATVYRVPDEKVAMEPKPHDCNFFASPIGAKYCEYERRG